MISNFQVFVNNFFKFFIKQGYKDSNLEMTESESVMSGGVLPVKSGVVKVGWGKLTYGLTCFYLFQCNCIKSKISGNIIEKYAILRKREHGNHLSVRK